MDKTKHTNVEFCSEERASKLVNNPQFTSLDEFSDGCYEV